MAGEVFEIQRRLKRLNLYPGEIDGSFGPLSKGGVLKALDRLLLAETIQPVPGMYEKPQGATEVMMRAQEQAEVQLAHGVVPNDWMPSARMKRIICHWSAGAYKASRIDREHYHIIIEADGNLVRGDHSIDDNLNTSDDDYAAHTRGCNTGSIGVSLACMAGATENPFSAGHFPMTKQQWDTMTSVCAELCRRYDIDPEPTTLLSHAEVQSTLGIAQRGKWDFTRLAFDPTTVGARECGEKLRRETAAKMRI